MKEHKRKWRLNPAIRLSWVWLFVAIAGTVLLIYGTVMKEGVCVVAAIPILVLMFPLATRSAFDEISAENRELPWVKNARKDLGVYFFAMTIFAFVIGVCILLSKTLDNQILFVEKFGILTLFLTFFAVTCTHLSYQLYRLTQELCALRAVLAQIFAFSVVAWFLMNCVTAVWAWMT
ncbi:MAG: hypothetical protein Q4C70_00190 [Planctomycetia bacterium]|nr:hypothetical protein [Planctomycetia bacterium]